MLSVGLDVYLLPPAPVPELEWPASYGVGVLVLAWIFDSHLLRDLLPDVLGQDEEPGKGDEEEGSIWLPEVEANVPVLDLDPVYHAHRMLEEREVPFLQVIEGETNLLSGDRTPVVELHPFSQHKVDGRWIHNLPGFRRPRMRFEVRPDAREWVVEVSNEGLVGRERGGEGIEGGELELKPAPESAALRLRPHLEVAPDAVEEAVTGPDHLHGALEIALVIGGYHHRMV